MLNFASKIAKDLKTRILEAVKRSKVERNWIGGKPIKTLEYFEGGTREGKVLHRQTSDRVTLPRKLLKRDVKGVRWHLVRNPKNPKDVTHLLIELVYGDENGAS